MELKVTVVIFLVFLLALGLVIKGTGTSERTEIKFREVSLERGINYSTYNDRYLPGNSGLYVTDFNRDSWPDFLALGGERPVLYQNKEGVFNESGVLQGIGGGDSFKSAVFFDYDNDGWEDLYLLSETGESLFLENSEGEFHVKEVGLQEDFRVPMGASAADYDGDGCLDVFVIQNGDWERTDPTGMEQTFVEDDLDNGNPNILFEGGCSEFTRVRKTGIEGEHWSLAASFVDLNNDTLPDIHVANDFGEDVLYVNSLDSGSGPSFRRNELGFWTNRNGMSSEVEDLNRDFLPDILVTNLYKSEEYRENRLKSDSPNKYRFEGNNLLINTGDFANEVKFREEAEKYNLKRGKWGWAAILADFNNDGMSDVFHSTGRSHPVRLEEINLTTPVFGIRKEDGFKRRDDLFEAIDGRGAVKLDFDRDGDLDILLADHQGRHRLYENRLEGGNWIQIRVRPDDKPALGTKVYLTANGITRLKIQNSKFDFLSQDSRYLHFGLGSAQNVDEIRIVNPYGDKKILRDVEANQRLSIN